MEINVNICKFMDLLLHLLWTQYFDTSVHPQN